MADIYADTGSRGGRRLYNFILGLLLGLLIGGFSAYSAYKADDAGTSSNNSTSNTSQSDQTSDSLVASESSASTRTLLNQYAHMLVEASRENVDAPSPEAEAAKTALLASTNSLVQSLGSDEAIESDLDAINNSMLTYANQAKQGDEHAAVDEAFEKLVADIQKTYAVSNQSQLSDQAKSLKNTLLESVRDFVKNDYSGSYAKQLQAEKEMNQLFSLLKKKQQ
jgi:hypothetical protein